MVKNLRVFQVLSERMAKVIGKDVFGSNEAAIEQVESCLANYTYALCNLFMFCVN